MSTVPDTSTEQGQREASRMLARLMPDWTVTNDWQITTPEGYGLRNLYKMSVMAQAWKVLNWASKENLEGSNDITINDLLDWGRLDGFWELPPAEAQRAWLDEILKLSIEAGLVAAANESQ